jgi:hypothetical protein
MRPAALAAAAFLALATPASAANLTVGTGVTVDLGTSFLDTGEGDLDVAGTLSAGTAGFDARHVSIQPGGVLNGGSALMQVCGDWSNSGAFNAGTSTVAFVDGCGVTSSTLTGGNTFHDLSLITATGKQVNFPTGAMFQTVEGTLTLGGAPGNLLKLRSTVEGSLALLDLEAPASGNYVDVKDLFAIDQPITLGAGSVISGNVAGITLAIPIPALGLLGLGALGASLYFSGHRTLSRRARADA